jgi:DNA-binding IclR family transcriptional regulator
MAVKKRSRPAVKGVATADRVLAVLTAFRKGDGTLTLAELASRTGLVKSTIMRLAVSLEKHGLMARVADSGYRLDAEVFRLGMLYRQSFRLENFVRPVLEELVARLGETASFYVQRGDQRQCLFRIESPHILRLHIREGDMLPLEASATSQVLRIFGSKPLPAYALTIELPIYTAGTVDPHTASLSTPVFGTDADLLGALTIAAPTARLTAERAEGMKATLNAAAAELTRSIGGYFPEIDRSTPAARAESRV